MSMICLLCVFAEDSSSSEKQSSSSNTKVTLSIPERCELAARWVPSSVTVSSLGSPTTADEFNSAVDTQIAAADSTFETKGTQLDSSSYSANVNILVFASAAGKADLSVTCGQLQKGMWAGDSFSVSTGTDADAIDFWGAFDNDTPSSATATKNGVEFVSDEPVQCFPMYFEAQKDPENTGDYYASVTVSVSYTTNA